MSQIKKILKNNKIVFIIILIFILLIVYKIISSDIQEDKETAVLQERARIETLIKKPLEDCLQQAEEEDRQAKVSYLNYDFTGAITLDGDPILGFKECVAEETNTAICIKNRNEWYQWREYLLNEEKDKCYKRYK